MASIAARIAARRARAADRRRVRGYVRRARRLGVHLEVHPTARLGDRLVIQARGDEPSVVTIGARSYLEDDCTLRLKGGTITIGEDCFVRRFTAFNVEGELVIGDEVAVGWACAFHAAERVEMQRWSGISERVTITDSRHLMDDPDRWFYHQSTSAPTVVGRNSWIASNSVVAMGVTVGDGVIVAANSTVLHDLPDGVLAAGSPARPIGSARRDG